MLESELHTVAGGTSMLIPRIIYQTTADIKQLRQEYVQNREKIAELNPTWEMKLFNNEEVSDFIKDHYGDPFLKYYLKINPEYGAARADFFRYLVIHKNGGLYLDIKSSVTKNLDSVINANDSFITSVWPSTIDGVDTSEWGHHDIFSYPEYQNWFILAAPKSKILEKVIDNVCQNIQNYSAFRNGVGRLAVLKTTGPIVFSKVLHQHVLNGEVRLATNDELGFKYTIYDFGSMGHFAGDSLNYRNRLTPIVISSKFNYNITKIYYFVIKFSNKLRSKKNKIVIVIKIVTAEIISRK